VPYLIAMALQRHMPFMVEPWQSQAFFASAYPAVLVALGLRLRYPKLLGVLGRASFHIFLFQILWFGHIDSLTTGRLTGHVSLQVIADVLICLAAGLLFARADERFLQTRLRRGGGGGELRREKRSRS
jgi:hypothetical protein